MRFALDKWNRPYWIVGFAGAGRSFDAGPLGLKLLEYIAEHPGRQPSLRVLASRFGTSEGRVSSVLRVLDLGGAIERETVRGRLGYVTARLRSAIVSVVAAVATPIVRAIARAARRVIRPGAERDLSFRAVLRVPIRPPAARAETCALCGFHGREVRTEVYWPDGQQAPSFPLRCSDHGACDIRRGAR